MRFPVLGGPTARIHTSLGQRPRTLGHKTTRAESPPHRSLRRARAKRHAIDAPPMGRAFSPHSISYPKPGALSQAGMGCAVGAQARKGAPPLRRESRGIISPTLVSLTVTQGL